MKLPRDLGGEEIALYLKTDKADLLETLFKD